ncbi:MAG TPA: WD40 repeat domain-containing protein, partial [Thermoanaerobaculia bacterium]|nr:WD40 repeat domain-containing protein [Thermoanaerobaculia bacterium]
LLRVWGPAVDWAERNRDFLHTRAHVAQRLREHSPLLEEDPLFGAAHDHLAQNPAGFPEELRAFIEQSVRAVEEEREREKRSRIRRKRLVLSAIAAGVLLIFGVFAYFSYRRAQDARAGQLVAEAERNMSARDFARAEIAAARALRVSDTPAIRKLLVDARSGGVRFLDGSHKRRNENPTVVSADGRVRASVVGGGSRPVTIVIVSSEPQAEWQIRLPDSARAPDSIAFSRLDGASRDVAIAWSDGMSFHVDLRRIEAGRASGAVRELLGGETGAGRHTKRIPSMAFHPKRAWIATGGEDMTLCLWDYAVTPPKLLWQRRDAHDTNVHGIAFNADGSWLASGGGDYKVRLWETAKMVSGKVFEPRVLKAHTDSVFAVAFSPDGNLLASGGYDRLIRIWDLRLLDGQGSHPSVGTLSGHDGTVMALSFTEDGKLLTSGSKDGTVRLWDVSEGRLLVTITPDIGEIRSVSLREFEGDLHAGGDEGWSVWSLRGHKMATRLWNGGATIGALAFDPSGRWIAAGGNDGKVRVWDRDRSFRAPRVLDAQSPDGGESINGIAFSPDGRWLAAAGESQVIRIWDLQRDWVGVTPPAGALRHDGAIWGLCFDAKTRWLYSSNTGRNNRIRRWDVGTWTMRDESPMPLQHSVWSLACAPGGTRLIAGDAGGSVVVYETERLGATGRITNVEGGEANVWSVAATESPVSVLSGNSDGRVRRWIPDDREWTRGAAPGMAMTADADAKVNPTINSISHSRKYGWIAAGGDGSSVEIYDAQLRHLRSLGGHSGTIWFVAFDPAGTRLAYGGTGRILRIFDLDAMDRDLELDPPSQIYADAVRNTGLVVDDDYRIVAAKGH